MKMLLLLILMTAVTLQPLKYGNLMVMCVYIYICMDMGVRGWKGISESF